MAFLCFNIKNTLYIIKNTMSDKCDFCNKVFETKQTLIRHQKTAKFCLKIQNKDNDIHSDKTCDYCDKVFTRKERLLSHLKICKNKKNEDHQIKNIIQNYENKLQQKNEIIEIYKKQVDDLQDKLQQLCFRAIDKPTNKTINNTTTNNNTMNLQTFFPPDFISNKIEDKFADSYFHDKMKGIAKFAHDHIVMSEDGKLLYKCYDVSRGIFKYKDDKGNEIKDVKALKLIKILQPDLMKQANVVYKYFDEYCEDLNRKLSHDSISDDDKEDARKELNTMKILKNKALDISFEINTMEQNNTFSNELAILTS